MKRALITGITGQDGSYLAELLLEKGCEVHGTIRPASAPGLSRLAHLRDNPEVFNRRLFLHSAELDDPVTLRRVIEKVEPDEIYHLAGQSHVGLSFEMPESTCELTAMGTLRLLEMIRYLPKPPRLFHAASSEIFGEPKTTPQDEETPFAPITPYGCAKAFAAQMGMVYRRNFGLFVCNGIMFNHESPRRGENFVTRKICRAAALIKLGLQHELMLGDLGAMRDWGHARDYVRGMWLMLQQPQAGDFVLATGRLHSVQDVVEHAFGAVGLDWRQYVRKDARFIRPAEPQRLIGNAAKAKRILGWEPQTTFAELIEEMTRAELTALAAQRPGTPG
jgi:GDPmannose 4,6-dehydratase